MKNEVDLVGTLIDKAEAYGETNIELIKLKTLEKSVEVISSLSIRMVLVGVCLILLLMLNIAVALWIGELYGRYSLGFFVVTGFNAILLLIGYLLRKNEGVENWISNMVLKRLYKEEET